MTATLTHHQALADAAAIVRERPADAIPLLERLIAESAESPALEGRARLALAGALNSLAVVERALEEAEPTPGAPNPAPPVCDTSGVATVKVNELLYNPDSTDTDNEWVEIFNAGSAAVRLDAWTIETATSEWAADFSFPSGVELAPGGFLVVGGPNVSEADYESDDLSLGNGTRADGVRIVACDGTVVDSVLYGEDLDDPITGDGGSTEVVPDVDEAQTIGRFPDGGDTDAAADWIIYSDPTPGEPNTDPDDDDDGGDKGVGGDMPGCGGAPTDGARPDGGCATALPLGGLEVLAAAIALARRRRPRA